MHWHIIFFIWPVLICKTNEPKELDLWRFIQTNFSYSDKQTFAKLPQPVANLCGVCAKKKKKITFHFICPDRVWDAEIAAWWDVDDDSDGWERGVTRIEQESERDRIPRAVRFCWLKWQQDGSLQWEQWCVSQIPLWLCTLTRITCTTLTEKNELNRLMSTIRMYECA